MRYYSFECLVGSHDSMKDGRRVILGQGHGKVDFRGVMEEKK
jgi:hypothetical protein